MREALRMVREWFEANRPGETFDCWFTVGEIQFRTSWATRYDLRVSYAGRKFSIVFHALDIDEAAMIGFAEYMAIKFRDMAHKMIRALESTPADDHTAGGSVPTR